MNHRPHWMQPTRVIGTAMAVLLAVTIGTAHAQNAPQAPGAQVPGAQVPGAQVPGVADVMRPVSPDAQAVLVVPSLAGFSESMATLGQSLNLGLPEMDDALGIFKRQSGMVQGVNDEGAMLVVVLNLAEAITQDAEPAMVMLMPVRDYAAFVGNFAGRGDAPVTELVLRGGQTGYAKQLDGYAVMGREQAVVEAYTGGADPAAPASLLGAAGERYVAEADAALFVNIEAIAPALLTALDEGLATASAAMAAQGEPAMTPEQHAAMVQPMVDLYARALRSAIESSRSFIMTVNVAGDGLALTQALHYRADSPMAALFPEVPGQAGAVLARLPDQAFVAAMAFDARSLALNELFEPIAEVIAQMRPVLAEQSPENAAMLANVEQMLPLIEQVQGSASAMYVPAANAAMTGQFIRVASVTQVDDPVAWRDFQRKYVQQVNKAAQRESALMSATYLEGVLQVDGQSVDQIQMNLPPQMQSQLGMMQNMMGGYVTVVEDAVLQTSLGDQPLLRAGIESVREGTGLGTAGGVRQVRAQGLGGANVLEAYLSVSGVMQSMGMMMPMMGGPGMQAPADLPPVAFGLTIEQQTLVGRTYVPHETSRFVADAVKPWVQMLAAPAFDGMQGPRGPGGPPRPPF